MHEANRLQSARLAAGWSQTRLIAAMRATSPVSGLTLPSSESLKTNITRWENGRVVPGIEYQQLFQHVYGLTADELGFAPVHHQDTDHSQDRPPALSEEALDYYGSLLGDHLRADNFLGPHAPLNLVRLQVNTLTTAARDARGAQRAPILRMAARYHEFYGWLLQDVGRCVDATIATDRARDFAIELGDESLLAYLMMRRSNIASDHDDPGLAAALADAALNTHGSNLTLNIRAVLLRQKANAHAGLGQAQECASAIGEAFVLAETGSNDGSELADYCTPGYLAMEAGTCWLDLGETDRALMAFSRVATDWRPALRRDLGLSLARRARAHAGAGEVTVACGTGHQAIVIYEITQSARTLKELTRLRSGLIPWARDPQVVALRRAIASLAAVV